MRRPVPKRGSLAAMAAPALVVLVALVAGCGQGPTGRSGGSIAENYSLSGPQDTAQFAVGSEGFAEQRILGNIAISALRAAGADVIDRTGFGGNEEVRRALIDGEIDVYWEYTATGWLVFLAEPDPIPDPEEQYRAVAERDLQENGIEWLPPAPANNAYAIAANPETAERLGVQTISDLARLAEERPEEATLCFSNEDGFRTRADGLPGLQRAYGMDLPDERLNEVPLTAVYERVERGSSCNFGVVFETSGLLRNRDLTLLEDEEQFFGVYNPSVTVSRETLEEYPQLEDLFASIAERLDTQTLRELNYMVEVEGQRPEDVADRWLRENGFIG